MVLLSIELATPAGHLVTRCPSLSIEPMEPSNALCIFIDWSHWTIKRGGHLCRLSQWNYQAPWASLRIDLTEATNVLCISVDWSHGAINRAAHLCVLSPWNHEAFWASAALIIKERYKDVKRIRNTWPQNDRRQQSCIWKIQILRLDAQASVKN